MANSYIRWFKDLRLDDVPLVGGKKRLAREMYSELTALDIKVPNGFAVTAEAFRDALTAAEVWDELHDLLDGFDKRDVGRLQQCGARARDLVYAAGLPEAAVADISQAYRELRHEYGDDLSVAVRSSRRRRICRAPASLVSTIPS